MTAPVGFEFGLYYCPCSAQAGYIGTDRNLLTGHNALHLRQIAKDILHYHIDMMTNDRAFGEPVSGTGGSKLVTCRMNC